MASIGRQQGCWERKGQRERLREQAESKAAVLRRGHEEDGPPDKRLNGSLRDAFQKHACKFLASASLSGLLEGG